jgi:DNA-binding transcriptional LysR family regulator
LTDEGFVLALPADSWLNRLPEINSAHLQNENFILPEQVVGTLQVASQGGFVPKLGAQPGGLVAVIALVSLGQGVAVVPESVVGHVSLPNVVYRQIKDCNVTSWLALIHRRFEKSAAVNRYIERVKKG